MSYWEWSWHNLFCILYSSRKHKEKKMIWQKWNILMSLHLIFMFHGSKDFLLIRFFPIIFNIATGRCANWRCERDQYFDHIIVHSCNSIHFSCFIHLMHTYHTSKHVILMFSIHLNPPKCFSHDCSHRLIWWVCSQLLFHFNCIYLIHDLPILYFYSLDKHCKVIELELVELENWQTHVLYLQINEFFCFQTFSTNIYIFIQL